MPYDTKRENLIAPSRDFSVRRLVLSRKSQNAWFLKTWFGEPDKSRNEMPHVNGLPNR